MIKSLFVKRDFFVRKEKVRGISNSNKGASDGLMEEVFFENDTANMIMAAGNISCFVHERKDAF